MESVPNILAERYASEPIREIWSPRGKILLERDFWIAVLKAQRDLGLSVADGAVESYEAVRDRIDLESIRTREQALLHDVKARIEEFNALAGYQEIHKGLTSRDLTENVEQLQIFRSTRIILEKAVCGMIALSGRAGEHKPHMVAARTHNVAAQATTIGKRLAMFLEEMLLGVEHLQQVYDSYPFRGLKGAVGTQIDPLTLFDGNAGKVMQLEERVLRELGAPRALRTTGQVYPRSLDQMLVSALSQLAGGPANLARMLRLMAGHETAGEGHRPGQVGSTAMPHKINCRNSERIGGFKVLLNGYAAMASQISGDQWFEGDVSCSVVRRVVLPDSFFTIDGLLDLFIHVVRNMEFYAPMIRKENRRYFPFLATTTIMMEAVKAGAGREDVHAAISEHTKGVAEAMRKGEVKENELLERLAGDERIGISREDLQSILAGGRKLAGAASTQVDLLTKRIVPWQERYPEAAAYMPPEPL